MEEIIVTIPKSSEYSEKLKSKQYAERYEQLSELQTLLSNFNFQIPIDENLKVLYRNILNVITKDKSHVLIRMAVEMVEIIHLNLGDQFKTFSHFTILNLLKAAGNVKSEIIQHLCELSLKLTNPDELFETLLRLFDDKNTFILIETSKFIYQYLLYLRNQLSKRKPQKILFSILKKLVDLANNSLDHVRTASFSAISAFIVVFGNNVAKNHISNLNHHKLKKIDHLVEIENAKLQIESFSIEPSEMSGDKESLPYLEKEATPLIRKYRSKERITINPFDEDQDEENIQFNLPVNESSKAKQVTLTKWNFDKPSVLHLEELRFYFNQNFPAGVSNTLLSSDISVSHQGMFALIENEVEMGRIRHIDCILRWFIYQIYVTPTDIMCKTFLKLEGIVYLLRKHDIPLNTDGVDMLFPHIIKNLFSTELLHDRYRAISVVYMLFSICDPTITVDYFLLGLSSTNIYVSIGCLYMLSFLVKNYDVLHLFNQENNILYLRNLERLFNDDKSKKEVIKLIFSIFNKNVEIYSELTNVLKPLISKACQYGLDTGKYEEIPLQTENICYLTLMANLNILLSSIIHKSFNCYMAVRIFEMFMTATNCAPSILEKVVVKSVNLIVDNLFDCLKNSNLVEYCNECIRFIGYLISNGHVSYNNLIGEKLYELKHIYDFILQSCDKTDVETLDKFFSINFE